MERTITHNSLWNGSVLGLTAILALVCPAIARGSNVAVDAPHALAVHVPNGAIKIDGRLDEPGWRRAHVIRLTQRDPHPGAPTPYHTSVRILADKGHLYFGIVNVDPQPRRIAVHSLQRDQDQSNDDHVTVVLDTFGGGRLAYWFEVNSGGAREDGLDVDDNTNSDWNGLWRAAVSRTAHGWTVEIAIDSQSLQFNTGESAWGLNIGRYVPRQQLSLIWSGITLNSNLFDLHRAGLLYGVGNFDQGLGLRVQPYMLARNNTAPGGEHGAHAGVDVEYHFTPQVEGVLTVNPDFAEAEAEQGQVNLGRFSLFLPERRPFFLEGSNLFEFAHDLNVGDDGNLSTEFVPYFSRRIGLVDGQVVPIDAGAKLLGHMGRASIGALDVQTGSSNAAPVTNLAVARGDYAINQNLSIGTLMTHGDPRGLTNNTFVGLDTVWHTSQLGDGKNLNVSGWLAHSDGNSTPGGSSGYGVAIDYPNDKWVALAKFNVFDKALDPALGFLPRPGTRQFLGYLLYAPRPSGGSTFGWVRQFQIGSEYIQVDDLDGTPQSKELALVLVRTTTQSGLFVSPVVVSRYEHLISPFNVTPGVSIPAGQYRFDQYSIQAHTPKSKPVVVDVNVSVGEFYNGTIKSLSTELTWTSPGGRFDVDLSNESDLGHMPQGNFTLRLTKLTAAYSFSPNLTLSTYAQYDFATQSTGVNARMEWIIGPGRVLYLVFNHGLVPQLADLNRPAPVGNEVIAKLSWGLDW